MGEEMEKFEMEGNRPGIGGKSDGVVMKCEGQKYSGFEKKTGAFSFR